MRCEGAELCRVFAAVDQRRQADRYLYRSKRVVFTARLYLFAGRKFTFYPRFVRWCPSGIKNYLLCLPHSPRQWKFRISDANLIALLEFTVLKNVHPISRSVYDDPRVGRNRVRPSREHRFVAAPCPP